MHALTQSKQLVLAFICFCIHVCVPKQPRNFVVENTHKSIIIFVQMKKKAWYSEG